MALAPALTKASASLDLSRFQGVQRIRNSTAVMLIRGPEGFRRYVLHPDRVAPLDTRASRIGHMLHEGTWAGPWSGMMNAFAALLDLGLIGLGVASLLSRRRRHTRAARAETPQRVGAA
jgi:sulfite reductase (NADPH) flavoprotein alpha-component